MKPEQPKPRRMKPRKAAYLIHRWVGLIVCVQLLAWSVGGLMFAILDIDTVHGDDDANVQPPAPIRIDNVHVTPVQAIEVARFADGYQREAAGVTLRTGFNGAPEYIVTAPDGAPFARVDAGAGTASIRISEAEALERAQADFIHDAPVASLTLIESGVPREARGRRAPLYRVEFDHPHGTRLYLDAVTGDVVARRNDAWRLFDWFWMLHIMDYDEREDFNHPLLIVFASLAVATSASGIGLWGWRTVPRVRRKMLGKKPQQS